MKNTEQKNANKVWFRQYNITAKLSMYKQKLTSHESEFDSKYQTFSDPKKLAYQLSHWHTIGSVHQH